MAFTQAILPQTLISGIKSSASAFNSGRELLFNKDNWLAVCAGYKAVKGGKHYKRGENGWNAGRAG
jgi:hypothetical protein